MFWLNLIWATISTALPYYINRPLRRRPYWTYGLMGINVIAFLITVLVSNINLPEDRVEGQKAADELIARYADSDPEIKRVADILKVPDERIVAASANRPQGALSLNKVRELKQASREEAATELAFKHAETTEGYVRLWQVQHMDDDYVWEPHYSTLNVFAYHPSEPSFWRKILGLFGSMFLHGGLEHILGNMVYLWVFGRALEEYLGPALYLGAYLLAGVAASLLYHVMTVTFMPGSAGVPAMGASGAIAGVLGLFAVRFYRTGVRIFYIIPWTWLILGVVAAVGYGIGSQGDSIYSGPNGAMTALAIAAVLLLAFGRRWAWRTFDWASIRSISFWVVLFNVIPGLAEVFRGGSGGGVAHWAHIGGFGFGMIYAVLIGSKEEGKTEYLLEDAQKAIGLGNADNAILYSRNLLEREPNNGGAHEVLAHAYDFQNNVEGAMDSYESAITQFLRAGERAAAARSYLGALQKHPTFIMPAAMQLAIGNQLATNGDFSNAAETLVKIPYTFPDAPEGEISLLRAAQIYLERLNQPGMAVQLLNDFLARYPQTAYLPQAQRVLKMAQMQMDGR